MSVFNNTLSDVLNAVSEATDITPDAIISKSRECEVVDARHICVKLLHLRGLYVSRIANLMKLTPRNIQYILSSFDARIKFNRPLRNNYERARKILGNI